jgi:malate dehydrogenase (oxaloacetate-decarboxylating)(NADP+)
LRGLDFARTDYNGPPLTNLVDIINYVKPTALLGLSTIRVRYIFYWSVYYVDELTVQQNAFPEEVVRLMASMNKRPIIFPLSNPISLSEVDYADAVEWYVLTLPFSIHGL